MTDDKKAIDAREQLKNLDGRIKQVASHIMVCARPDAPWTREAVHKIIMKAIKLHLLDKRKTAMEPFLCPSCDHRVDAVTEPLDDKPRCKHGDHYDVCPICR